MYLLGKSGGHRSQGNGDIKQFINNHVNTLEKAELIVSISLISKSGILIYNSEIQNCGGEKDRKIAIAKCYAFQENATNTTAEQKKCILNHIA